MWVGIGQGRDDSEPQASVVVELEAAGRRCCWQCYHSYLCCWRYDLEEELASGGTGREKGEEEGSMSSTEAGEAHQYGNGGCSCVALLTRTDVGREAET